MKVYGFSVLEWCKYVLKDRFWLDEIFLKLLASMWSCRISVIRCNKTCGEIELGEDEMIVKKEDWDKMEEEVGNLRKEVKEGAGEGS